MTVLFDGMVMADYHQFYLADTSRAEDLPSSWTDEDLSVRLLAGDGAIVVMTARNMDVALVVELREHMPEVDVENADHVVIARLHTAGEIVIAGLTDYLPEAARVRVPKGALGAMIVSTGLRTLSEHGLDGEDRYTVYLWPGSADGITVLRQWQGD